MIVIEITVLIYLLVGILWTRHIISTPDWKSVEEEITRDVIITPQWTRRQLRLLTIIAFALAWPYVMSASIPRITIEVTKSKEPPEDGSSRLR